MQVVTEWNTDALMKIILEVVEGPHQGKKYEFACHDTFIVGRASFAHFQLPRDDPYLSRVQFMVEVNPPHCRVQDMGSQNGTWVNGQRVDWRNLQHGDQIRAGRSVFQVSFVAKPQELRVAPPPLPAAAPPSDAVTATDMFLPEGQSELGGGDAAKLAELEHFEIEGYRLLRKIGQGGMGSVYLADSLADGQRVALKTIGLAAGCSERDVARFLREAQILSELDHPNIVRFYKMGSTNELTFFTMDHIPGTDAGRRVVCHGPLPMTEAIDIACQALDALEYAHRRGFVHRDVKPSNLLLTDTQGVPTCKLVDFGLARIYQDSPISGLTLAGTIGGTVPFMPPEQITSYREATPAADQYSAAATLYFLLTAKHIFRFSDTTPHERLKIVLFNDPIDIARRRPETPAELGHIIHRALSKTPEDRYPSAAAFRQALAAYRLR